MCLFKGWSNINTTISSLNFKGKRNSFLAKQILPQPVCQCYCFDTQECTKFCMLCTIQQIIKWPAPSPQNPIRNSLGNSSKSVLRDSNLLFKKDSAMVETSSWGAKAHSTTPLKNPGCLSIAEKLDFKAGKAAIYVRDIYFSLKRALVIYTYVDTHGTVCTVFLASHMTTSWPWHLQVL